MTINPKIFRANDIRGEYPEEINENIVSEIVNGLADLFSEGKIIVAHDIRLSSSSLYKTVLNQFKNKNHNLEIIEAGLATTPMFYFLVKKNKAVGGIMITASHNPKNYNGLKVIDKNALPISGTEILKILLAPSKA